MSAFFSKRWVQFVMAGAAGLAWAEWDLRPLRQQMRVLEERSEEFRRIAEVKLEEARQRQLAGVTGHPDDELVEVELTEEQRKLLAGGLSMLAREVGWDRALAAHCTLAQPSASRVCAVGHVRRRDEGLRVCQAGSSSWPA